jgi:xanthine dehydrogenase YagR molybdenum-binding subunit
LIGAPLDRVDGRLKVTGGAKYAAEFQVPNVAHAVLVQSVVTAGSIVSIDGKEALAMPGVIAVITPDNALKLKSVQPGGQVIGAPLLQDTNILFNGQHIAVVVAETLERAQDAASKLHIRTREDEAVIDMKAALTQAYPPMHFRGGERPPDSRRGDPEAAFGAAAVKLDATYTTPVEHHNPMEPHATIAAWQDEHLTVWTATQGISDAQQTMSTLFGIPPENVRVICPYVGGGFGCKGGTWPPATLAAMAAKIVGRPVKLVLSRAQMFTSNGYRPRTIQTIKLGAERDGRIVSLRHDGYSQMSMPSLGEFSEPFALASEMLYAVPAVAISHRLVGVNQSLPTFMRGPGEASGMFALESAMDEMAHALGIDPIELRRKNHTETDLHANKPFSNKKLLDCYRIGAERFGWESRTPAPRSMREGTALVGWGMATTTYPANRRPATASATLYADGSVVVCSGTQDLGTGTYTVMAQVAADALGMPASRVRFELGDSRFPKAPGSGGSSTVASVSPAVQAACAALRERILDLAQRDQRAGLGGVARADLRFENGVVIAPSDRVRVAELLARSGADQISAEASAKPGDEKDRYSSHSFGAQFAEVRVDPDLGEIRVARLLGVFDAGRVLNAKTARSQLIGGMVFGLGMALLEQTHVDAEIGRITNANVSEYLMAVNADVPHIDTVLIENSDPVVDPLGARGLGELPTVGVAAAIANAVFHATGTRVRDLPIRVEDVLS